MMNNKAFSKAFSLTELVVVIAITAILATVGMSSYATYKAKATVVDALTQLNAQAKFAQDSFIQSNTETGSKELAYKFDSTAPASLKDKTLILEVKIQDGIFTSSCKTDIAKDYLPSTCTSTATN